MNETNETSLFVYGTLVDTVHRESVIGRSVEALPATISGYERGRTRHFVLRSRPGAETSGLILLNLTPRDFEVLDKYEQVPELYTRESVEVVQGNGVSLRCWVYLPTALALME